MPKTTKSFTLEVATYEAAKKAGINISAAAEKGVLAELGHVAAPANDPDPVASLIAALNPQELSQAEAIAKYGAWKEPGVFGKVHRYDDVVKWLEALLRVKYRVKTTPAECVQAITRITGVTAQVVAP